MSVDKDELHQREMDSLKEKVIELKKRVNELEFERINYLKELNEALSNAEENKILKEENKRMTKNLKISHDCLEDSVKEINRLNKP